MGKMPDKHEEIEKIRVVCQKGRMIELKPGKVDLCLQNYDGSIFLFDLKTAKPNIENFKSFKRKLLQWCAIIFAKNPGLMFTLSLQFLTIRMNQDPYKEERWTVQGDALDLRTRVERWQMNFGIFWAETALIIDLLDCFESELVLHCRLRLTNSLTAFKS